jgi:hypothetical protein
LILDFRGRWHLEKEIAVLLNETALDIRQEFIEMLGVAAESNATSLMVAFRRGQQKYTWKPLIYELLCSCFGFTSIGVQTGIAPEDTC